VFDQSFARISADIFDVEGMSRTEYWVILRDELSNLGWITSLTKRLPAQRSDPSNALENV
jgi:hypothetical protein